ncbi:hypothetical protein SNE40_014346 [Patella caerulea]|uniref:Uncharacterized protein n=1 Tax=Patella caerulea TaxID=87958 RepID=A0AAN8JGS1_PATCE
MEGKKLISKYLAAHVTDLNLQKNVTVDIDSEHHMSECQSYTTPIRCCFSDENGLVSVEKLQNIKQRKGEAEMAQIDWLFEYSKSVSDGEAFVSLVTSGDIDAVVLHLFAISKLWKRNEHNRHFINPVYVLLQKPNNFFDIFNITGMLEILEDATLDYDIGIKLAAALSLGGNDYTPKFYGMSHSRIISVIFQDQQFKDNFLKIKRSQVGTEITIDRDIYKDIIKTLYCPKYLNPNEFSFDEIRQLSVSIPKRNGTQTQRNPKSWMPPQSTIDQLSKNINCLLQYYSTAGYHSSYNPNFIEDGCLMKTQYGDIEYDLGPDAKFKELNEILPISPGELLDKIGLHKKKVPSSSQSITTSSAISSSTSSKRKPNETPQKGRRRKTRPQTSTPR